jgi:hypothetical protein
MVIHQRVTYHPFVERRVHTEMSAELSIFLFIVLPIIFIILWIIYYNVTQFTKVITVGDKFQKYHQVGNVSVRNIHGYQYIDNTRRIVADYIISDTEKNLYNIGACLLCGFYMGKEYKYIRVMPGDVIEIKGYGGYFDGIPDIYSIKFLKK